MHLLASIKSSGDLGLLEDERDTECERQDKVSSPLYLLPLSLPLPLSSCVSPWFVALGAAPLPQGFTMSRYLLRAARCKGVCPKWLVTRSAPPAPRRTAAGCSSRLSARASTCSHCGASSAPPFDMRRMRIMTRDDDEHAHRACGSLSFYWSRQRTSGSRATQPWSRRRRRRGR